MSDWQYAEEKKLKDLYGSGVPIRQIARILGRSVGSISGKIGRINKPKSRIVSRRTTRNAPSPAKVQAIKEPQAYVEPPPEKGTVFIEDLEDHHCRFPCEKVHSDRGHRWSFCGKARLPNLPYCEDHAVRCYKPTSPTTGQLTKKVPETA